MEIGNAVSGIQTSAFCNCLALTGISIPNSVISVGQIVFSNCSSLVSAYIPESLTTLPRGIFCDCSSLVSVNAPAVSVIEEGALSNCIELQSVKASSSSALSVGTESFLSCVKLTSFDSQVSGIGHEAFKYCTFSSLSVPSCNVIICNNAFICCENLSVYFAGRTLQQVNDIRDEWGSKQYSWGLPESQIIPGIQVMSVAGDTLTPEEPTDGEQVAEEPAESAEKSVFDWSWRG